MTASMRRALSWSTRTRSPRKPSNIQGRSSTSTNTVPRSKAEWIASLNASDRRGFLESLTDPEAAVALYEWAFWARKDQRSPPGDWRVWLLLAGRGFGKTRTGAEWVRERIEQGVAHRIALIAPTPADARDVMVQGESGLIETAPPWCRPIFEPSKRRVTWPNGAQATIYSGYEPDQLRGPQHDTAWCDELASWQYPRETWDNLQFGMRLGDPRTCITTTPKPIKLLRELLVAPHTHVTTGSTYENAPNLPAAFFEQIVKKYEGTSLGEQELHAKLLDEAPGALLTRKIVEACRIAVASPLKRIVVAIDPAATDTPDSSETGIIVAGIADNGHGYVLQDLSGRLSPDAWARRAVMAYHERKANKLIGEQNNGGQMVEHTVHTVDRRVAYWPVVASRGKHTRAEPIAALYEQGKIHHIGAFPDLEDQWCTWVPGEPSPDRLDACVWALSDLMLGPPPSSAGPVSLEQTSKWR